MKSKLQPADRILVYLLVLFAFYSLEPYFTWKTFMNGIFGYLGGIIPFRTIIGILFIAFFLIRYRFLIKIRSKTDFWFAGLILLIGFVLIALCGGTENTHALSMAWIPFFVAALALLLPGKAKREAYRLYYILFTVTLVLPLIYYLLLRAGIQIPYQVVDPKEEIKMIRGFAYKVYPLAAQRFNKYDPLAEVKLCGIYDESGKMGTVCALLLTAEQFRLKYKPWNAVLFAAGALSFSLAFYIICIIYFVCNCVIRHDYKRVVAVLLLLMAYVVFINVPINNASLKNLQSRITITSQGLSGDNRTNDDFDSLMQEFVNSESAYTVLFGYGDGAIGIVQNQRNIDGSSYKSFIYNYGYVGFALIILWLLIYALQKCKSNPGSRTAVLPMLVVYIMNMYQRPTAFSMMYLLIFIGCIENNIFQQAGKVNRTLRLPMQNRRICIGSNE